MGVQEVSQEIDLDILGMKINHVARREEDGEIGSPVGAFVHEL